MRYETSRGRARGFGGGEVACKRFTIARPMPLEPPVTAATLFNDISIATSCSGVIIHAHMRHLSKQRRLLIAAGSAGGNMRSDASLSASLSAAPREGSHARTHARTHHAGEDRVWGICQNSEGPRGRF